MSTRSLGSRVRAVGAVFAALSVVAAVAGCGGSGSSPSSSSSAAATNAGNSNASGGSGQTLNLGLTQGSFTTFNPWGPSSGINGSLWSNGALYDSLTRLSPAGTVEPGLATAWTVKGKAITLTLRSGVTFTDGTPVDAAAVKANMTYGASQPNGAECNAYLAGIKTTVNGPTSVTLTPPKPVPGLLQDLAQCAGFMVSPKALAHPSSLVSTPDGSGPYTLDQAGTVLGQKYTFVRRAGYWDASAFPFKSIVVTAYATSTAADNAASSGQVEYVQLVSPGDTSSGLSILASKPDDFQGFYVVDSKGEISKPLGNQDVRQAMNYALNRPLITKALFGSDAVPFGSTPFPPQYAGYTPALANYYTYNVTKAKQLLATAGYPNGFTVNALVDPGDERVAQAIAGQEAAIGVKLNISIEGASYITDNLTGKWPLVFMHYTLNPAEEQTLEGLAGPSGFWNAKHNDDPAVDAQLKNVINASSPSAATSAYAQLAATIAQHSWFINPVVGDTLSAANTKTIKVGVTSGVPVPFLYNIQPAG